MTFYFLSYVLTPSKEFKPLKNEKIILNGVIFLPTCGVLIRKTH